MANFLAQTPNLRTLGADDFISKLLFDSNNDFENDYQNYYYLVHLP